jgi:hypothetical protein
MPKIRLIIEGEGPGLDKLSRWVPGQGPEWSIKKDVIDFIADGQSSWGPDGFEEDALFYSWVGDEGDIKVRFEQEVNSVWVAREDLVGHYLPDNKYGYIASGRCEGRWDHLTWLEFAIERWFQTGSWLGDDIREAVPGAYFRIEFESTQGELDIRDAYDWVA